jgi:hypothetical protein
VFGANIEVDLQLLIDVKRDGDGRHNFHVVWKKTSVEANDTLRGIDLKTR